MRAGALTFSDRVRIAELVEQGVIPARIARALGHPVSTITRELASGRDGPGYYPAAVAQARAKANATRPQQPKLAANSALLREVQRRLDRKDSRNRSPGGSATLPRRSGDVGVTRETEPASSTRRRQG